MREELKIGHGHDLAVRDVIEVAREGRRIKLADEVRRRVDLGAAVVDVLLEKEVKVYGLTTGFASLRNIAVQRADAAALSLNLIRSHSSGVGRPFAEDVVRAALLMRAHALARGDSGARSALIQRLIDMLNNDVYPYVPQQGSVGSSGDLAPLSHLVLACIGDPSARVHKRLREASRPAPGFERAGDMRRSDHFYIAEPVAQDFEPLEGEEIWRAYESRIGGQFDLEAKEGLASNNGAIFSTALLALGVHDAGRLIETSETTAAMSCEAIQAVWDFLHEDVIRLRPHKGHVESAARVRAALERSQLVPSRAPLGLNLGRLNLAIVRLSREMMDLEKDAGKDPEARARQEKQRETLERLRGGLLDFRRRCWQAVEAERGADGRPPLDAGSVLAYPKAEELVAWDRALSKAGIRASWRDCLRRRQGDDGSDISDALWERLLDIYHEHIAKMVPSSPEVQDNYSFRASVTILGAAREACARAKEVVEIEINSGTDNPLIPLRPILTGLGFGDALPGVEEFRRKLENGWSVAADAVKSAANFHGQPIGSVADYLAAAVAEIGDISERRISCLTDARQSKGLPSYLVWRPGLNSGFMISQYTAASLVTENRLLAMPASTDSVPTGESSEDHVAMSTLAARKLNEVIVNAERITAIELLCAYQGVQFRKPARLGRLTAKCEDRIADSLGPLFHTLTIERPLLAQRRGGRHDPRPDPTPENPIVALRLLLEMRTG
ncbi:MAG TPA: aromatic amino acid ammonia-lyase, partial [Rhizomicrobium sp.]|nr:aromatic amino acid ammonia-lyase [Rhizomicrobium sp.]